MALAATTVWEIQADGIASDNNGGGFVAGTGTDYTQGADQKVIKFLEAGGTYTNDLASTSASSWLQLTSAAYNANAADGFCAADVGNLIHITAGTNFIVGWYEIKSVAGNVATLDRACGNTGDATGGSGYLGGPLLSIGGLGAVFQDANHAIAGMRAYIKGGTYNLTGTTVNVSGGPLDLDASQMNGKKFYLKGYAADATRDAWTGTRPYIDAAGQTPANAHIIELKGTSTVNTHVIAFVEVDGDDLTVRGIRGNGSISYDRAVSCIVHHCDNTGFYAMHTSQCYAHTNVGTGFGEVQAGHCRASGNTGYGFYTINNTLDHCIADNNGSDGFMGNANYGRIVNCTSYNNAGDGFDVYYADLINCLSYSNGGYEYNSNAAGAAKLWNCASGDVASGRTPAAYPPLFDLDPITLTADPFTNKATGDFSLNTTAGGGAACRGVGLDCYGQTSAFDIGAVQHADPAGGGGTFMPRSIQVGV